TCVMTAVVSHLRSCLSARCKFSSCLFLGLRHRPLPTGVHPRERRKSAALPECLRFATWMDSAIRLILSSRVMGMKKGRTIRQTQRGWALVLRARVLGSVCHLGVMRVLGCAWLSRRRGCEQHRGCIFGPARSRG